MGTFKPYAIFLILIILALALSFSSQIYGSSVDDWSMFRHDAAQTGFSEGASPTASAKLLWNYRVDATATYFPTVPVVTGGFVYVATADQEQALYGVSCFKSSTGVVVWSFRTEGFAVSTPAVNGDHVYVGSGDPWKPSEGYIYCLDASDGVEVWNYSVGEPVDSPVNFAENRVFFESSGGNLYCLDAAEGNKVWNYSTGGKADGLCPAVADNYVFVGNHDGNVICLNASNGAAIWNFTADDSVSSPTVAYGYVYFGSGDGNAYCVNASSGDKVWNYTTWFNSEGPTNNYHWGNSVGGPAVAYGYVFVGSSDFDVFCLDALTGEKVWNVTTSAEVYAAPSVAERCVYVGSYDGNVYCLNASSGMENWRYAAGIFSPANAAGSAGSPVIANGEVYVVGNGVLSVLGLPSSDTAFPLVWVALFVVVLVIVLVVVAYAMSARKRKGADSKLITSPNKSDNHEMQELRAQTLGY